MSGARQPRRARALAAGAFAGGLALALATGRWGNTTAWGANLLSALAVTGLLWGPVMLEARTGRTWRWLDNPVLAWIGERSYAIYLWHVVVMAELYPVVRGLEGYKVALAVLLPLTLLASAAVAELSWRFVERPALRLKRRRPDPALAARARAGRPARPRPLADDARRARGPRRPAGAA